MIMGYTARRTMRFARFSAGVGAYVALIVVVIAIFAMRFMDGAFPVFDRELLVRALLFVVAISVVAGIIGGIGGLVTATLTTRVWSSRVLGACCCAGAAVMAIYAFVHAMGLDGRIIFLVVAALAMAIGVDLMRNARRFAIRDL